MNDVLLIIVTHIIVIFYGFYFVAAYFFKWTMYTGGPILEPGKSKQARLFFLVFGMCIALMASYYLWAKLATRAMGSA